MSKYKKHRVKLQRWEEGVLYTYEEFFDNLDDAHLFLNGNVHNSAKIHDKEGSMILSKTNLTNFVTYA